MKLSLKQTDSMGFEDLWGRIRVPENTTRFTNHLFGDFVTVLASNQTSVREPELRTRFPLTAFKNAPNPKFVPNLSPTIVFGFQSGVGPNLSKICRKLENDNFRTKFQIFRLIFDKFGPP